MKKKLKEIMLLTFNLGIFSVLIILLLLTAISLFSMTIDILNVLLTFNENKNAMIFDLIDFNYKQLIFASIAGFIYAAVFLLVSNFLLVFFSVFKKNIHKSKDIAKKLWTISTVIFFVCTLLFWLDEKGFMIATTIISFAALIKDPLKIFWESRF